jgi:hypothetical protein
MGISILPGLFNRENRQKRYVAENLGQYVNISDAICFGRYPSADDMMGLLSKSGVLDSKENKDKNIYCASRRSKAYALSLGISLNRIGSTEDLKVIGESQRLYAGSDEEVDAIINTYSAEELSKKYIICDNTKILGIARDRMIKKLTPGVDPEGVLPKDGPGRAILESSANEKREKYVFIDGVDQIDQNNYLLVGDDMRLGFVKRYSMKDLKELIYFSTYFAAVSKEPQAEYLGENGKRLVVQYHPGMEAETLNSLQRDLMLTDEMLAGRIIRKSTAQPQKVSFTRDEMNVMTVPFDSRLLEETNTNILLAERMLENDGSIGSFGTGLCAHRKPHGVVYVNPRGGMEFKPHYRVHSGS